MVRVLVTGGKGQLGQAIRQVSPPFEDLSLQWIDQDELDLTNEPAAMDFLLLHRPDWIVNCAAYTAVDRAEQEPELAMRVNGGIPYFLAEWSDHSGCRLIHLSTDYVYNGNQPFPHSESEIPMPESVYGHSKRKGEQAIENSPLGMIIRTSWLYGEFGNNFMKTMIKLGQERKELSVVFDQTGTPTYSSDLARAICQIISNSSTGEFQPGIYNYSNEGTCSWYDFAVEIMRMARLECMIKPILSSQYPLPAKRPVYSVMDKKKIRSAFSLDIPHWRKSLELAIASYLHI